MALPPAHVVEQGRQEAIEAVRRTIAPLGDPVASDSNLLVLSWHEDGQPTILRLVIIKGDKMQERRIRCNTLCTFLANRQEFVQAFSNLSQKHQIAALLLQEE